MLTVINSRDVHMYVSNKYVCLYLCMYVLNQLWSKEGMWVHVHLGYCFHWLQTYATTCNLILSLALQFLECQCNSGHIWLPMFTYIYQAYTLLHWQIIHVYGIVAHHVLVSHSCSPLLSIADWIFGKPVFPMCCRGQYTSSVIDTL